MVCTWHREGEHRSGAAKIFSALILFAQFFIVISEAKESGFFWQLTDVHWDQRYSSDGDPVHMCHQTSDDSRLGQSAIPPKNMKPAGGQYGRYSCDAPWDLIELSIKGMAENSAHPDFIIWTGDNTPHVKDPSPDWSIVFSSLRNVSRTIKEHFPNTSIIPVLGNHDVYPEDFYPSEETNFYHAYLTEGKWDELLSPAARESFGKCGFYSMQVQSQLQVVVLNTNLYNTPDNLTRGKEDPCGQFTWFEQQLQLAQAKNTKILLAAHIPPGFFERWIGPPFFNTNQNDRYVQLIQRYGNVILTHVYGHTHTDSFRIFGESHDQVQSVAFVSPSVTPWLHEGGVNPSLRLYEYNPSGIRDYWQYYLNLTNLIHPADQRANDTQWQLLYQATTAYDVADLSATSVLSIYKEMVINPQVFQRYYFYNTVGHVFKACDAACVRDHLCTVAHLTVADMEACQAGRNVFFRGDPRLSDRFAQIARQADWDRRRPWLSVVIYVSLTVIFTLVCSLALVLLRRRRSGRHRDSIRYQPFGSLDKSKYVCINSDEI